MARPGDADEPMSELERETQKPQRVVVTDVDIRFWTMVGLLTKVTFAAIPAAIIVFSIVFMVLGVTGLLSGLFKLVR